MNTDDLYLPEVFLPKPETAHEKSLATREPILNPTGNYIHTVASEYFLTSNHSDNHMLLILIEKLKNGRDSFRKARETHLIHKAKTTEPLGINKRGEL